MDFMFVSQLVNVVARKLLPTKPPPAKFHEENLLVSSPKNVWKRTTAGINITTGYKEILLT